MKRMIVKGAAHKPPLFLLLLAILLAGCGQADTGGAAAAATWAALPPPPLTVPISDGDGAELGRQAGPLWVLLSGVDEHGLVAEHEVGLLAAPDPASPAGAAVHSGSAVYVLAIRQTGPQNLQRFYQVQALNGLKGWVSDFYVRRLAYLYDETADAVLLYQSPDGAGLTEVANISPVILKETTDTYWWRVESPDGAVGGWVTFDLVKESPELEFLGRQQHMHE